MVHFYRRPATGAELLESQTRDIKICAAFLIALPTLAGIARLWARVIKTDVRLWWDDFWLVWLIVTNDTLLATFIVQTDHGLGRHIEAVPENEIIPLLKMFFADALLYNFMSFFYKTAAIFLYLRIFGTNRRFSIAALSMWALLIVYSIIAIVLWAVQCDPPPKAWDPLLPGHCEPQQKYYVGTQCISALFDIAILILPLPMIRSLDLPGAQRMWLILVFCLGYIVAAIPFVRLGFLVKDAWILSTTGDPDFTWNSVFLDYLIVIEGPVAIIGLCSPPIFQLIQRVRQRGVGGLFHSTDLSSYASKSNYSMKTDRDRYSRQAALSTASSEPRRTLVDRGDSPEPGRTSADEIALSSILQGKNINAEQERLDSLQSPKLGHGFNANATGSLPHEENSV